MTNQRQTLIVASRAFVCLARAFVRTAHRAADDRAACSDAYIALETATPRGDGVLLSVMRDELVRLQRGLNPRELWPLSEPGSTMLS